MTLREKRCWFTVLVARLIQYATGLGYEVALGEVYRSKEEAARQAARGAGIRNSLHTQGLAVDLHLYIGGVYQTTTEAHRELGAWWKQQHPNCRWGGDFRRADGNHYEYNPR